MEIVTKVVQGMIPPGGWHYMQEGKYKIESDCFSNLCKAVQEWRIQNARPQNDVVKDIEDYICGNSPRNCNLGASPVLSLNIVNLMSPNGARMVDKISAWVVAKLDLTKNKPLETSQEASRRSGICTQCPMNKQWEHECGPCVTHAQRFLSILRQGQEAEHYRKLHACKVLNHCNRTAVWLKIEHLDKAEGVPTQCWCK